MVMVAIKKVVIWLFKTS